MSLIDPTHPVMITAASGYVASWVVRRLLEGGCTVHAAVGDPSEGEKLAYLNRLADESDGQIKYFQAELLREGSYAEAMNGCRIVFHTASPFNLNPKDPEKELYEPAKLGTRNVLDEANRNDGVQRVVLTSSCAAIYGDNIDLRKSEHGKFTEHDWNETSSLKHLPCAFANTVAEREAWRIASAQKRWDLVVLNPSLVLGPAIDPQVSSPSSSLIKSIGNGAMRWGVPNYCLAVVDVRDLADAHIRAAWLPTASGRNIISGHNTDLLAIAKRLRERFSLQFRFPKSTLPKSLVWLLGPILDKMMTRGFVSKNVGYPCYVDNAKSMEVLGMKYRRLDDTLCDTFQQMIDRGMLRAK